MSMRTHRALVGLAVLVATLAPALEALAASEGGCQVTLTIKRGESIVAEWVNSSGPQNVFLNTYSDHTFSATCSCGHDVTLTSNISTGTPPDTKGAGPGQNPSFTHSFMDLSVTAGDTWVKATCPAEDPDTTSQGVFSVGQMKLERVGNTSIEPANTYSENTTVCVTAVIKDGVTCTTFTGTVNLAEIPPSLYTQNGGTLPASVTISSGGTTTFVAKSIAGAQEPWTTPPDDAEIETTNYSVYNPGARLKIPQWVDNNSNNRVDWCEQWTDAFLSSFQSAGGELELVADTVSGIGADTYTVCWGSTDWDTNVVHFNPAAEDEEDGGHKMRTNTANYMKGTVLHESRHAFVSWDTNRGVGEDHGAGPDNDDDPGGGDYLPEVTYHHTEADNGIRDHANPEHEKYNWWGDDTNDYVNAPPEDPRKDKVDDAHEDDAWDFDLRYRDQ